MARPLTTHRGQKKPWTSIPRINWDHPLARGLISYCYDTGSGPIDLVTGGQRTFHNAARVSTPTASPYGSGFLYNRSGATTGAGAFSLPTNPALQTVTNAAPYSFACAFMPTVVPASAIGIRLFGLSDNSSNFTIGVGMATGTATDFTFAFGNSRQSTTTVTNTVGTYRTLVGVALTGSTTDAYIDGVRRFGPGITTTFTGLATQRPFFQGIGTSSATQGFFDGYVYYGAIWKGRALTAAEARQLHYDPYCFLIYPEDELLDLVVGGGPPPEITGTFAVTEAADTAAFAGSVIVDGSLAVTEAADTAAFAGTFVSSGTLAATEAVDTAAFAGSVIVAGTFALTDTKDTAAFVGDVIVSGLFALTEAADTAALAGYLGVDGPLAATEAADTAEIEGNVGAPVEAEMAAEDAIDTAIFFGSVPVSGTLAVTEARDTAAIAGGPVVAGTLVAADTGDMAAFAGGPVISVALAATEAADTAAFAGYQINSGTLAATEPLDVAALFADAVLVATLAATDTRDTATFAGGPIVSGTLVVAEAIDTAALAGGLTIIATFALTEAPDSANFDGVAAGAGTISGTLEASEIGVILSSYTFQENAAIGVVVGTLSVIGTDTAAFDGHVGVSGALAVTETQDTAAIIATLPGVITGTLAANEAGVGLSNHTFPVNAAINTVIGTLSASGFDVAAFAGTASGVAGFLTATEAPDTAFFSTAALPPAIAATLAVTDTRDTAALAGMIGPLGVLVATEARDVAAIAGTSVIEAVLAAVDAPDSIRIDGILIPPPELFATFAVTEARDTALFLFEGEETPADFANWQFGRRFDRSLTARFPWQSGVH